MSKSGFGPGTLRFLKELRRHNDREWFHANRARYEEHCLEPARGFVAALGERLADLMPEVRYEPKVNGSILRQARDARFAPKDKPYQEQLVLRFWSGATPRAGPLFWFRLGDRTLRFAAGIHTFSARELPAYRAALLDDERSVALGEILGTMRRRKYAWDEPHYKRVPDGMPADHPCADLLRHKGLLVHRDIPPPKDLGSRRFVTACANRFVALAPLFAWLDDLV